MKKLALSIALLTGLAGRSWASAGDLFDQVVTDSHFTILESVSPIYYYDVVEKINQGGAVSSFYKVGNGFLTADAGWVNSIEDSTQKGGALLGGDLHGFPLFAIFFPDTAKTIRSFLPASTLRFADSLDMGFAFKHNFQRDAFTCGFFSGVNLKF